MQTKHLCARLLQKALGVRQLTAAVIHTAFTEVAKTQEAWGLRRESWGNKFPAFRAQIVPDETNCSEVWTSKHPTSTDVIQLNQSAHVISRASFDQRRAATIVANSKSLPQYHWSLKRTQPKQFINSKRGYMSDETWNTTFYLMFSAH